VSRTNPTTLQVNDSANSDDDDDGAVTTSLSAVTTSEEKLLKALKTLKAKDEEKAQEAARKVVQRLADADLITQP
jgi:hypothetical protein